MSAKPGWYRDKDNPTHARWWNGTAWTDQVRPIPGDAHGPSSLSTDAQALTTELAQMRAELQRIKEQIVETSDVMLLQEVGIYRYSHPLDSSAEYETKLADLSEAIKTCVKNGEAVSTTKKWAINGSEKDGARMVADFGKLVRASR